MAKGVERFLLTKKGRAAWVESVYLTLMIVAALVFAWWHFSEKPPPGPSQEERLAIQQRQQKQSYGLYLYALTRADHESLDEALIILEEAVKSGLPDQRIPVEDGRFPGDFFPAERSG